MNYYEMGEKVVVSATMFFMYVEGERLWLRRHLEHPKEGFYVGYTYKREGKIASDDFKGQSYLIKIKSIKMLRVKFSDWGNDYFALLQDVRRIR